MRSLNESPSPMNLATLSVEEIRNRLIQSRAEKGEAQPLDLYQVTRPRNLPLSFAQQRLWFLSQMEGASEAYNESICLRIRGPLDEAILGKVLNRLVWRHETLRTTFKEVEGEPTQVIGPRDLGIELKRHVLTEGTSLEECLTSLGRLEIETSFDLANAQPIRATLVRIAKQDQVLLLVTHHIASDGWSMNILAREIRALYSAFARDEDDPLPPLSQQYADYAIWQRQWLSGAKLNEQRDYWHRTLAGAPEIGRAHV